MSTKKKKIISISKRKKNSSFICSFINIGYTHRGICLLDVVGVSLDVLLETHIDPVWLTVCSAAISTFIDMIII